MVDIHSHFLPGIDDGSKNFDQTSRMLHQAVEVGITDLISTSHLNEFVSPEYLKNIPTVFEQVNNFINKEQLDLKIHLGAEIILDTKTKKWAEKPDFLLGKHNNYFLFELSHFFEFSDISNLIFDLKLKKITPILAHPERSPKIQENPEILVQWINQGCVMQMNAGSIIGQFGKKCESTAKKFLDAGAIHLIASDAHEPKHRNYYVLKQAQDYIVQNYDAQFAEILFRNNPLNILKSKSVKFFDIQSENLKNKNLKYYLNKFRLTSN